MFVLATRFERPRARSLMLTRKIIQYTKILAINPRRIIMEIIKYEYNYSQRFRDNT